MPGANAVGTKMAIQLAKEACIGTGIVSLRYTCLS